MSEPRGTLEIIIGCMFSGKTSEMIRRLKRFKAVNKSILVINSTKDTRSEREVRGCSVLHSKTFDQFHRSHTHRS
jgi:thymidine kinase